MFLGGSAAPGMRPPRVRGYGGRMEPMRHRGYAHWSEPPVDLWADALARTEAERLVRVMSDDRARGIGTEETVDRVLSCLRRLTPEQRAIVAQRVFGRD